MTVNKHKSLGRLSRVIHLSDSKLRCRHLRAIVTLIQIVLEADARGTWRVWGFYSTNPELAELAQLAAKRSWFETT